MGIQGEEPDAWLAFRRHVGSEVYLGEVREPRDGGQEAGPYTGHFERCDTKPRAAFEGVDAQGRRYEGPERVRFDGPVHEEQGPPTHPDGPWTGRDGVGAVLYLVKNHLGSKCRKHERRLS